MTNPAAFACRQATGGFKGCNRDDLVFELSHTKLLLVHIVNTHVVLIFHAVADSAVSACRQATGGFKERNRDGLVFELSHTKLLLVHIVKALQGVHSKHTLHGDVKPDNLLVSALLHSSFSLTISATPAVFLACALLCGVRLTSVMGYAQQARRLVSAFPPSLKSLVACPCRLC